MSGIIDWNGEKGVKLRNRLIGYWLGRLDLGTFEPTLQAEADMERMKDGWRQKTCLGCGSATQPCCGH